MTSTSALFKNLLALSTCLIGITSILVGQDIKVKNPSFEGIARQGYIDQFTARTVFHLDGWEDCGMHKFRGESPPDIHPGNFWGKTEDDKTNGKGIDNPPSQGTTYLGMVARANNTYESVSQKLSSPLKEGQCYLFSIDMVRSTDYWSVAKGRGAAKQNFDGPLVLRIFGSNSVCYKDPSSGDIELLAESGPVGNTKWQTNIFTITPSKKYKYITLEAFYQTPLFDAYLGHILLDNASDFIEIDCGDTDVVMEFFEEREDINIRNEEEIKRKNQELIAANNKDRKKRTIKKPTQPEEVAAAVPQKKTTENAILSKPTIISKPKETVTKKKPQGDKILKDLRRDRLVVGQKLKLKKLYFLPDTTQLKEGSTEVLEELAEFLKENKTVKIEVGGHTNGVPDHDYCDKLSTERAKMIADYLVDSGVDRESIKHTGYGKRKPVASNKSIAGRKLNQRVEITILQI